MSVELQPLGVQCNLKCSYCYQNPMRDAGNEAGPGYDLDAMMAAAVAEGAGRSNGRGGATGVTLFGGEPLLLPIAEVRQLFEKARAIGAPIGIQTNGTLITDAHVALFKEFSVGVGVSMDGPDELNDTRWNGNLESTRALTARSQTALERLLDEGMNPSLIVTLTVVNAGTSERVDRLVAWLTTFAARGLRWANLHHLEVDGPLVREHQALSQEQLVAALRRIAETRPSELHIVPLDAYRRLLLGDDEQDNCVWHACDPYTTSAVRAIDGQGVRGNCGRTNKDGVTWVKADTAGHERQLALYFTPREHGGCAGCRFFFACKGECPGTAQQGDWRNRTEHCATIEAMLEGTEAALLREGREPLSLSLRRPQVEATLLQAWAAGRNMTIASALRVGPAGQVPHGDIPHGDAPHGDHQDSARPTVTHGDHQDASANLHA
jgi:uncharacterized protein